MKNATFYIQHLNLQPHPEGGFYKETYKADETIAADALPERFNAERNFSTAIYYLLEQDDFSAFHKIKSDECWHHYAGDTLLIHILYNDQTYKCIHLGKAIDKQQVLQFVVPANTWFAAECAEESKFVLTGCTVAPGFDFADFEMADKERSLKEFTEHQHIISKLCR